MTLTTTPDDKKPDSFGDEGEKGVLDNSGETVEDAAMKDVELPPVDDSDSQEENSKIPWYRFNNVAIAQGYNLSGMARGAIVMSNVFLSTSFIYLANEEAGCLDEDDEVIEDCDGKAYGFEPAIIVTNIAVIAGVLSALFMPFIGAMVDYTPHRKTVGIVSAVCILLIQTAQIGTVSNTWLIMAFLQALAGFLFQAQVLSIYAYLPDMSYMLGEETMTKCTLLSLSSSRAKVHTLSSAHSLFPFPLIRYVNFCHDAIQQSNIVFICDYCHFSGFGVERRHSSASEPRRQCAVEWKLVVFWMEALASCGTTRLSPRRATSGDCWIYQSLSDCEGNQRQLQTWCSVVLLGSNFCGSGGQFIYHCISSVFG